MAKKKQTLDQEVEESLADMGDICQVVEESFQGLASIGLAQKWDVVTSYNEGYDWVVVYSTWDVEDAVEWIDNNLQGQLKAIKASTTDLSLHRRS